MKLVVKEENLYILKFTKGEEFFAEMKKFCQNNNINGGTFTAIGATDDCVLSYYDHELNKYIDTKFGGENLEVVGLTGNIAVAEDNIIVHTHGTISGRDLRPVAGHIKKLVISITLEVSLWVTGEIKRKSLPGTELFLME